MQGTLAVVLLVSIISVVQAQTWEGNYTTDSSCDTTSCCCLSGKVIVASGAPNVYAVVSGVNGVCGGQTIFTGIAYTNGYSGWMVVGSTNDTLTLSSDSQTVTVINPVNSACNGRGTKSAAMKEHVDMSMMFAILVLLTMAWNYHK
ncbi:unnamed protein product [Adineta ricciae]|uniref:Uncharacterized protein n=1 Tax=Adineta ricciae TaxID=249248 RepID=A0A815SPK9_ADIRI|nr:unnamed protein product [Adineta ricciae]CAF1495571.1 unnamed protein product [Adineta ricciae]